MMRILHCKMMAPRQRRVIGGVLLYYVRWGDSILLNINCYYIAKLGASSKKGDKWGIAFGGGFCC